MYFEAGLFFGMAFGEPYLAKYTLLRLPSFQKEEKINLKSHDLLQIFQKFVVKRLFLYSTVNN